jgi:hypothetical protein
MNYVVKNRKNEWEPLRLYDFKKFENEIYYRDAVIETNPGIKLSLADLPMANGILRVDKISADTSFELRLGHYALPNVKGNISTKKMKVKGYNVQIIDNGIYQLAMVSVKGWKSMEVVLSKGLHPVSNESSVMNATGYYTPGDKGIYMVLMLWKRSGEEWTKDELVPFKSVSITSANNETATIVFKNGEQKIIR